MLFVTLPDWEKSPLLAYTVHWQGKSVTDTASIHHGDNMILNALNHLEHNHLPFSMIYLKCLHAKVPDNSRQQ